MSEQHPWEAWRRHEGRSLPGLSGSRVGTIGAACTNSKLYGLTQSRDLWLLTMMATATAAVPGPTTSYEWCLKSHCGNPLLYSTETAG